MLAALLFILILVTSVGLLTAHYRRQPLKSLGLAKPSFVFFPKYRASYQRSDDEVVLTIQHSGFRPSDTKDHYTRGTIREGLGTKSIKLTVFVNHEKKEIEVYSTFFGVLYDNGGVWQLTHDIVHGVAPEKDRTQQLHDLYDGKSN